MSVHIKKSHNKSLLLYHLVCPAKFRKRVFTPVVENDLKNICLELGEKYEINFIEIGVDSDHVHFLLQSIPTLSPSKITQTIKSITAKEIFKLHPELKTFMNGNSLWTSGFYMNTVSSFGNESTIQKYVKSQGKTEYKQIHQQQISLWD
jgi:REP element-mobilizing transposase RayT